MKPRSGNKGVLYWTDNTRDKLHLEDLHQGSPLAFPCEISVSTDFATVAFALDRKLGDFIALVFTASAVETRYTHESSEAFLEV